MTRSQAIRQAREGSKTKNNIQNYNRVYAFRSEITNQYHKTGEHYTQAVGEEKSFNVGGKQVRAVYFAGKNAGIINQSRKLIFHLTNTDTTLLYSYYMYQQIAYLYTLAMKRIRQLW